MTYASRRTVYATASQRLRDAALASEAEIVDNGPIFLELCPETDCPEYLFPDHHPNANGYRVMAESIVRKLREAPL